MSEYNGQQPAGGDANPQQPNYAYGGQQPGQQQPNYAYGPSGQPSNQGGYSPTQPMYGSNPNQGGYSSTQPLYGGGSQQGGYMPPQPPLPPKKKFPWLWVGLIAAGLVAIIVLVVLLTGGKGRSRDETVVDSEPATAQTQAPEPSKQAKDYETETNASGLTVTRYNGGDTEVVVPANIDGVKVTAIGDYAFDGAAVTSLTIPEGVTQIGNGAFSNCVSLENVIIPESVSSMGSSVFAGSKSITRLTGSRYFDSYDSLFATSAYISLDSPAQVDVSLYYGETYSFNHSDFAYSVGTRRVDWTCDDEDVAELGAAGIQATPWQWDTTIGYYEAKVTGKVENSDISFTYALTVGDGTTYTQYWADTATSFSTSECWTKFITPSVENCYGYYFSISNEVLSGEPFGVYWRFMTRLNSGKWSTDTTLMIEANTDQTYEPVLSTTPLSFSEYVTIANVTRASYWKGSMGYYIESILWAPVS